MSFADKIKNSAEDGLTTLIHYEPGNSTKYIVMFQGISPKITSHISVETEYGAIVMLVTNFPSYPLFIPVSSSYISLRYFMEKTGFEVGDAEPLLELLNYVIFDRSPGDKVSDQGTGMDDYMAEGGFGPN